MAGVKRVQRVISNGLLRQAVRHDRICVMLDPNFGYDRG